ncbi:helix-turn-helix domain-containing protein [Frankia sp. AgB1.9]|uniref:helix-turn-helix domain-containing protein n=1 Tax=unclassified Frankia TaxID=2632575 RepID=UPI0019328041|nr:MULTISPECIES: helix-turn-helix transcriptional regulator [unclassified Frankia]MBL7487285.1 helix-turn-helix domain-containing protein [Frankia sp. AgW1.1]MBL7546292.1 helix-turn-helix domain-containing protein [Frankia sp. AgB1.9]MBL7618663.1 helix-turn-helix domain-containing protein [Frankia sp. AgB1.8]
MLPSRPLTDGATNAVIARRRLAQRLRRYRQRSGLTVEDVARALVCSPSKISRMETAVSGIRVVDLAALAPVLGMVEDEKLGLDVLVRQARVREWWQEYTDVVPAGSGQFFGLEDGAAHIRTHNTSLIPGLLQTADYARALFSTRDAVADERAERMIALRLRRQRLLDGLEPTRLTVLFDEAVLRRVIGGKAVMSEQWKQILRRIDESGVITRVIPHDADVHPADGLAFTLFEFDDEDLPPVVFAELLEEMTFIDDPHGVARYAKALAGAEGAAASAADSRQLIVDRIAELRG